MLYGSIYTKKKPFKFLPPTNLLYVFSLMRIVNKLFNIPCVSTGTIGHKQIDTSSVHVHAWSITINIFNEQMSPFLSYFLTEYDDNLT